MCRSPHARDHHLLPNGLEVDVRRGDQWARCFPWMAEVSRRPDEANFQAKKRIPAETGSPWGTPKCICDNSWCRKALPHTKHSDFFDSSPPIPTVATTPPSSSEVYLPKIHLQLVSSRRFVMDSNSTTLLPGQSPPISIITATDKSGVVLIATALALAIALISLLMRFYMQSQIRHQYAPDDMVAMGSMVSTIKLLNQNWFDLISCLLFFNQQLSSFQSRRDLARL